MKKCPFENQYCTPECELYIEPDNMSETVRNKLASIGIIARDHGFCSFKIMALSQARQVFERSLK